MNMNKEKFINKLNEELEELKGKELLYFNMRDSVQEARCTNRIFGIQYALNCARLLDEPQKVKVPAYVREHIEYSDSANWSLLESIQEMNGNVGSRELANWFEAHSENYARAWLDGYEVEEETKYQVKMGDCFLIKLFKGKRSEYRVVKKDELIAWEKSAYNLTEQEIKSIDERYWPFAVPVEEVAEG